MSFLGQEQQRAAFERAGFDFASYRKPGPWTATGKRGAASNAIGFLRLITGRSLGRDLLAEVKKAPPDLVVIDCLLFGALNSAAQAGLRRAVLVHSLYDAVDRKMASGAPGAVARMTGLRPRRLWAEADLVIVATLEELDRPSHRGSTVKLNYTGPVLTELARDIASPAVPPTPTILVSLSTTYVAGQAQVLQKVLDAVRDLPVRVLVTTGPAVEPDELQAPANTALHRYLPHAEVMPTVSLVVGHGGHSTTMLALAHDLPLVILPINLMFDQVLIGRIIEEKGAGAMLPSSSPPAKIRAVIEQVLADDAYRSEAERLGKAIRASRGRRRLRSCSSR
ncbi:glycosyltransferase [Cryobacterium sp. 10C3]|uniref:glycosyltransferase n=1 Tax=Cryobacterium sp. 10C3 TaxID=3048577 RepID=UPI002AB576B3|nr:nucleotide disphospho-sugar-binding domain-containing protein [Cryobacterium sp. 10C3]MDY7555843.1 glycosyltransferase [Cryobacterium sp. 10C3]